MARPRRWRDDRAGITLLRQLVSVPLSRATAEDRLVESLAAMWEDEAARCAGGVIPPSPPTPERDPQPLGAMVAHFREQFARAAALTSTGPGSDWVDGESAPASGLSQTQRDAPSTGAVHPTPAGAASPCHTPQAPGAPPTSVAATPATHAAGRAGVAALALTQPANAAVYGGETPAPGTWSLATARPAAGDHTPAPGREGTLHHAVLADPAAHSPRHRLSFGGTTPQGNPASAAAPAPGERAAAAAPAVDLDVVSQLVERERSAQASQVRIQGRVGMRSSVA